MNPLRASKASLTLLVLCVTAALTAPAQTFTTLSSLSDTFGGYPIGPLVQGIDGKLYGAGFYGGLSEGKTGGTEGTVLKSTSTGTLSLLHDFHGTVDGLNPTGLALALNGNLYGTASAGGANPCITGFGCGTVFGLTSGGTLFILHNFTGTDGRDPVGGLTLGPDGNFYGTTQEGGPSDCGTIFKITPSGTLTTLHTFNCNDGAYPDAPLVLGINGSFYGTTQQGGTSGTGAGGDGTVFVITPGGSFTTIHNFNGTDGAEPYMLVQAANGNFYGTTNFGGKSGEGSIFLISPGGRTFQTLYTFTGGSDGYTPWNLVLGADGNFYGTTSGSGQGGQYGTIFEITPAGVLTTLHAFDGTDGGNLPTLMQDTNGTFYGTTREFGANYNCAPVDGCGTVFSLSTGLGPFINSVPPARGVGARMLLLGQGFTGATSVTFNGISATFTVDSDTEITATVPAGATKGYIKVVTPSGTLSTKVIFPG